MRLVSKRQLKELVLYSHQHIARLEAAGKFPKRVRLGASRVGWIEDEVLAWLREGIRRRDQPTDAAPAEQGSGWSGSNPALFVTVLPAWSARAPSPLVG